MGDPMDVDNAPSPLMIRFNPGKLVEIATVSFVANFLHHRIEQIRENDGNELNIDDYLLNLTEDVLLPPDLVTTIRELPEKMITTRTQWWAHHQEFVFSRRIPGDNMIDWFDKLVWLPDGTISYPQTAKKLLNGGKLTKVQKFQLACEYCLVEDVEYLKETLTNEEINEAVGGFRKFNDIQNYWCGKLKSVSGLFRDDFFTIINSMINSSRHYYYEDWSAIEYFFNLSSADERSRIINLIINSGKPRLMCNLLAALTGPELDILIKKESCVIITTLAKERRYLEYILLIWKRIVNVADNFSFAYIMHRMNDSKYEENYVNSLLWEMWLATSEPQKTYIIDRKDYKNILKVSDYPKNYYIPNFSLIVDVLSRLDPKQRHEYWLANWPVLVIGQSNHLSSINRIMKLCLETDEKIEDFKKTTMIEYKSIAKYCERLIINGRIKEIQIYLEFCTKKEKVIRDLKKEIITTISKNDLFTFLFNFSQDSSIADFYDYLEEIRFAKKRTENFVYKVISHPNNLKRMRHVLDKRLQDVIKFIEKFVHDEENLARMKLIFFQRSRRDTNTPLSVQLDLNAWCLSGDQGQVEKLKEVIPKPRSSSSRAGTEQKSPIYDSFMKSYLRRRRNDDLV